MGPLRTLVSASTVRQRRQIFPAVTIWYLPFISAKILQIWLLGGWQLHSGRLFFLFPELCFSHHSLALRSESYLKSHSPWDQDWHPMPCTPRFILFTQQASATGLAELTLVGRVLSSRDLDLEFTIDLALKALSSLLSSILNSISLKVSHDL